MPRRRENKHGDGLFGNLATADKPTSVIDRPGGVGGLRFFFNVPFVCVGHKGLGKPKESDFRLLVFVLFSVFGH